MSSGETPVQSPCTNLCVIDPGTGWCAGCLRTLDEIARWGAMTDDEKRAVLAAVAQRRDSAEGADDD